jgi:hypothetical protein
MGHLERELVGQPELWCWAAELAAAGAPLPKPGDRVALIDCGTSAFHVHFPSGAQVRVQPYGSGVINGIARHRLVTRRNDPKPSAENNVDNVPLIMHNNANWRVSELRQQAHPCATI